MTQNEADVDYWAALAKGPALTEDELLDIKDETARLIELKATSMLIEPDLLRRLLQTCEMYETGIKVGNTVPYPAIDSKVYDSDCHGDYFECIVREHLPDGSIRVFEPGCGQSGMEHVLTRWVTAEEFARITSPDPK